jgi:integrating conjugative element protein (TIGR03756 family)
MSTKLLAVFLLSGMVSKISAMENTRPPHPLNSLTLATRVIEKTLSNSHYKVIGSCQWQVDKFPPHTEPGLSVEQFLPDLIVTVSNNPDENPWIEARMAFENKPTLSMYQAIFMKVLGFPLGFGSGSGQLLSQHLNEERTRIVHVIGSPAGLYRFPKVSHKPETHFGKLYYSSLADAVSDRTESGEILYMATHSNLLIGHEIGTSYHSWGHEIPRLMRVTQPSRFRASVVAAMHAADIVTNKHGLHVAQATTNRCGKNCVVSNVVFDPERKKVIWQEVYPHNRNIRPGDPDDFGVSDEEAGNGNYVFVLWRKYRGCISQHGKLIPFLSFPKVGKPEKR